MEIPWYVYLKFNSPTRARNSEVTNPIRPEPELVWDFIPVLVTSKFDDDPIKMNELAWRHRFPIISLWDFFQTLKGS